MKKLTILLALGLLTQSVQAQLFSSERLSNLETFDAKFLTWGYFLGFNSYDFKIEYNDELVNVQETLRASIFLVLSECGGKIMGRA